MRTRSLRDRRVTLRYVDGRKFQSSFAFIELLPSFRCDLQNAAEEKGIESMLKTVNKITNIQIYGMNTIQNPVNPNKYCVGYGLSLNLWLEELD